jgi:hypothetical protein
MPLAMQCWLTIPGLIYLTMTPRFPRTRMLAHPYWIIAMNTLYNVCTLSLFFVSLQTPLSGFATSRFCGSQRSWRSRSTPIRVSLREGRRKKTIRSRNRVDAHCSLPVLGRRRRLVSSTSPRSDWVYSCGMHFAPPQYLFDIDRPQVLVARDVRNRWLRRMVLQQKLCFAVR